MDKENIPKKPLPSIRDSSRFGTGLFSAPLDPEILSEILADLGEVPSNIFEDDSENIPEPNSETVEANFFETIQDVLGDIGPQLDVELIPEMESIPEMQLETTSPLSQNKSETNVLFEALPEVVPLSDSEIDDMPEIAPEVMPEIAINISPEVMREIAPEDVREITPEFVREIAPKDVRKITPVVVLQIAPEIMRESAPKVMPKITSEAVPEIATEDRGEMAPEVIPEITTKAAEVEALQEGAGGDSQSSAGVMSSSSNSDILIEPIFGEPPYFIPNKCQKFCSFEYQVHQEPSTSRCLSPKVAMPRRFTRKITKEEEIKKENYRKFQEELDKIEVVTDKQTEKKKRVSKSPTLPKAKKEAKKAPPKPKKKQPEPRKPAEPPKRINKRKQAHPKKRTQ